MSEDLHPNFFKTFFTEELYLIPDKGTPVPKQQTPEPAAVSTAPAQEPEKKKADQAPEGVLIILKHDFQQLESSQKELLTKITAAVKVDLSATKIISEAVYKADLQQLASYKNVLSFGVELAPPVSKYMVSKRNEQQFLASDSLAALEQAIALKGKLWKAMQDMFPQT